MTATKIYKTQCWKNFVAYEAVCACGHPDCNQQVWLEVQNDDQVTVSIHSMIEHRNYLAEQSGFIGKMWWRLKSAAKVIFTGRLTAHSTFIFDSPQQVRDYTSAINTMHDIMQEETEFTRILNGQPIGTSAFNRDNYGQASKSV